jgi:hypothetical protein
LPDPTTDLLDPLLCQVADRIAPLFETGRADKADARATAISALLAYDPKSRADFVNIARILAFSIASLVALGLAAAEDLPPAQRMRYFGRANALNRSADQTERTMLQRRREQHANPPAPVAATPSQKTADTLQDEAALDAAVDEAMALYRATIPPRATNKPETQAARPNPMQADTVLRTPGSGQRPTTPYRQTLLNGSAMPHVGGGAHPKSPLS